MRVPATLSWYFGKQFFFWIMLGLLVCGGLIFLVDMVEVFRKSAKHEVAFHIVIKIATFRLPNLLQQLMPFAFLFGAILCFSRLNRSRELVIARASGISVWQFIFPSIFVSIIWGVIMVTVINPVSAVMNYRAAQMENKYFGEDISEIIVSKSGLWLKQRDFRTKGETLITAASISPDSRDFKDITVFEFDTKGKFSRRIDAKEGRLLEKSWIFKNAILNQPESVPKRLPEYTIPTNLSLAQIQDSFSAPETISFWALPDFIKVLEQSGFSALRHKIYFQSILATPLVFVAMLLIAAVFSLRFSRRTKYGIIASSSLFFGFLFFFITKLTNSFGMSGEMPVALAAWTPTAIFITLGVWFLLHLEDG